MSDTQAELKSSKSLWENKPPETSQVDFDPILFTDHDTGRTVVLVVGLRRVEHPRAALNRRAVRFRDHRRNIAARARSGR